MTVQQMSQELEIAAYNFNELAEQTDLPAKMVRTAIMSVVNTMFEDPQRASVVGFAVGEIVKDVEVHGDPLFPREVDVTLGSNEVIIDTLDRERPSEHNGIGRAAIQQVFGSDYSWKKQDGVYTSHLVVRGDRPPQGHLPIYHAA